jgi:hypothetical protein
MFDKLTVECRAGYKADETPVRFALDDRPREVVEVCDRWYDPEADYFKVRADDGYLYLLRHDHRAGEWSLRYVRFREPSTPLVPPSDGTGRGPH